MDLRELKSAVARPSPSELAEFSRWFEEFMADAWDRQIEELRQMVAIEVDQADRGEVAPLDMEAIRAEGRRRLALREEVRRALVGPGRHDAFP